MRQQFSPPMGLPATLLASNPLAAVAQSLTHCNRNCVTITITAVLAKLLTVFNASIWKPNTPFLASGWGLIFGFGPLGMGQSFEFSAVRSP